jgi:hypothetical protein
MLPCFSSDVEYTAFLTVFVENARESAQFIATELSPQEEDKRAGRGRAGS